MPAHLLELEKICLSKDVDLRLPARQPAAALQVQDAHVLVPTTGVVSAASIAAAKDLQLIVQPASGGLPCMVGYALWHGAEQY